MDNLPPELLQEICKIVCTDGGHTGRVLSAISRRIREAVGLHKYHSLAVNGLCQIERLVATLKASGMEQAPIYNLCIGCDDTLTPEEREKARKMKNSDPLVLPRRVRQNMTEQQFNNLKMKYFKDIADHDAQVTRSEALFISALGELLQMCRDTLRIISITVNLSSVLPSFSAPNLISLTLTAHLPNDFLDPDTSGIYPFPSLRRLHLGKNSSNHVLLPKLTKACPHLTHLRVRQSYTLPPILAHLLGQRMEEYPLSDGMEVKPVEDLQRLVVDMSPIQDRTQAIVINHIASSIRRIIISSDDRGQVRLADIPTAEVAEREWEASIVDKDDW